MGNVWTVPATVLRVVDGDTVRLELDLGWHTYRVENCRVAGINAPELSTEAGKAARAHAEQLLPPGARVTFISQKLDKYGRPLGRVVHDGVDFGAATLAAGHASPFMTPLDYLDRPDAPGGGACA